MITVEQDAVCVPCRSGLHNECNLSFTLELATEQECCCNGEYDLELHLITVRRAEFALRGPADPESASTRSKDGAVTTAPEPLRGESGYIHPDAWPSAQDIGSLADPASTGRKRVFSMYPITPGQVCDWARLKNCGGGPEPIIGCMGNPASELHHGPDKNTLNNEKMSRGVGTNENVHAICSYCHNWYHSRNDKYYPAYDRIADQASPWLPHTEAPWLGHEPVPATLDELMAEETRRSEDAERRGRKGRGRNGGVRGEPELGIQADG